MNNAKFNAIPVIFDTDMDGDCDDAGALAVLHALMDFGKANILGVICDVPLKASADCVMAINRYYKRDGIPVGLLSEENEAGKKYRIRREASIDLIEMERELYTEKISHEFNIDNSSSKEYWDAVSLYRHLLAQSADKSVVIVAVGFLTVLNDLLDSSSDEFSPLSGRALIKQKVSKLVTMGEASFPSAKEIFNWVVDWDSAKRVIDEWPTELVVQSLGAQFLTGRKLSSKTPESNPVRRCYEIYLRGPKRGNFCWDLITALYGVCGCGPYFNEKKGYRIILEQEPGKNHWIPDESDKPSQSFLEMACKKIILKNKLEDLMVKPPSNK